MIADAGDKETLAIELETRDRITSLPACCGIAGNSKNGQTPTASGDLTRFTGTKFVSFTFPTNSQLEWP